MTDFVFPSPPRPAVAIAGSAERFPVRGIFCVGRDHTAHARVPGTVSFTLGPPR